jgi:ketosteroid isomerase-like protein
VIVLFAAGPRAFGQQLSQGVAPCAAPEYRQFDFWLGDWDVFERDGTTRAAHVRVERALDGCALYEYYEDRKDLRGQSVTIYDRARKVWHQTWVTNRGQLLSIEGRMDGDEIILSGSYRGPNGEDTLVRGTWKPNGPDVRETAVTSTDGGKTWNTWFDLVFRRVDTAQTNDDAKMVARLDTEYQAAVKHNDVATMDRILADDFVLVTGSGKVVTKTALLEEARGARTIYERQEDSDQVVRVWGNTAIVTAKLWAQGTTDGNAFEYTLWFSDTYVRTPGGWRYVFGQASLPLTKRP